MITENSEKTLKYRHFNNTANTTKVTDKILKTNYNWGFGLSFLELNVSLLLMTFNYYAGEATFLGMKL